MRLLLVAIAILAFTARLQSQNYRNRAELYPSRYLDADTDPDKKLLDSLKAELERNHPDTIKADILNALAGARVIHKGNSGLDYALRAKKLATEIGYDKGLYFAEDNLGSYYGTYGVRSLAKSLEHFTQMEAVARKNLWNAKLHRAYSCILNLYFYMGDFPAAMKMATDGLELAEKENNIQLTAHYKNLLGFIHLRQRHLSQARKHFERYKKDAETISDSLKIMDAQIGLAEVLLAENKPDEAISLLSQTTGFFISRFNQTKLPARTEKVPYSLFAMAKAFRDKGDPEKAYDLCLKGFSYSDSFLFNDYDLANFYLITGSVLEKLNRIQKAIEVYNLGIRLSLKIHHAENIRDGYAALSRIFAHQKKFDSAYHYEQLFEIMKDSIVNVRTRSEIQRINAQYDISKKDQELEQQQQMHEAELKQQAFLRNSILIVVLALAIITWLLYNRHRLNEKHRTHEQLSSQRAELLSNFIHAQNTERNRLARDIHDQVGTLLSAAKLKLSEMEETLPPKEKARMFTSLETLDLAADFLRSISHNLVPASLSRLGLIVALEHFFLGLQKNSSVSIQYSFHNFNGRLTDNIEINLYPVVLELTNNVLKHASAKTIVVQLIKHTDRINITIEDDGIGFNYEKAKEKSTGLGLASVESRVEILKGNFHIDSVEGRGTIAMLDIPN
jgi:two-component system, NarL family, sensor kinase